MKRYTCCMLLLAAVVFVNCSSATKLQRRLVRQSESMQYLHDTNRVGMLPETEVTFNGISVNRALFPDSSRVNRSRVIFLPLLLVWYYSDSYDFRLGQTSVKEDIGTFFEHSFREECRRTADFRLTDVPSGYTLDIEIDSVECTGPYRYSWFMYFALYVYGYGEGTHAGPATAALKLTYTLKHDGAVVMKETVAHALRARPFQPDPNRGNLVKLLCINMAESLSEAIQLSISDIITGINTGIGETVGASEYDGPAGG